MACHVQQLPLKSERFVADVRRDIPFSVATLSAVPGQANVFLFRCENLVSLLPDYEIDDDGACAVYRTTFMSTHDQQPDNIIWRNIIINAKAQRVLCIDRMTKDGKTFGYIYVLQSETKEYSDTNTYHWDVSDPRLMLNVSAAIEGMTHLSTTRVKLSNHQHHHHD